jgi:hypothetical protein
MGLRFLSTKRNKLTPFDLEKYIGSPNHIPLVIFPENTKTNRKGVLSIKSNLMDMIYNLVNDHQKLLLRAEITVKKYKFFSPNNTIDVFGLMNVFWTCCQFYNEIELISQDIQNNNFDKSLSYDRVKYNRVEEYLDSNLQSYLGEPNYRNTVCLTSRDHIAFLEYFNQTHKDASYVKKEEN